MNFNKHWFYFFELGWLMLTIWNIILKISISNWNDARNNIYWKLRIICKYYPLLGNIRIYQLENKIAQSQPEHTRLAHYWIVKPCEKRTEWMRLLSFGKVVLYFLKWFQRGGKWWIYGQAAHWVQFWYFPYWHHPCLLLMKIQIMKPLWVRRLPASIQY